MRHGCGPTSRRADRRALAHPVRSALAARRAWRAGPRASCPSACAARASSRASRCRCCCACTSATGRCSRCACSTCRGLRARPGGEPLHHRVARLELPLARRLDGRPDPAARRRPADHRRGLPPARPANHAAGLPPRAAGRVRRRSWSRRPSGRSRTGSRTLGSTCTPGRAGWRCAWRCGRCSGSTRTAAAATAGMAEDFEETLGYWGKDYVVQMLRGPGSPWRAMNRSRAELDRVIFDEIGRRRASGERGRGHPVAAARRRGRGRLGAVRPGAARPGDDAAVRRARHGDLHRHVPVLRARAQPARDRAARRGGERHRAT